jgi:hypothetical protein
MNVENKDFVPFEIAVLLKEKDFNEWCSNIWYLPHPEIAKKNNFIEDKWIIIQNSSNLLNGVFAPLQYQIQNWLLEKHGIFIGLELVDNTKEFYYQPNIWTMKDREYHDEDMIDQAKHICKWREWQFNNPQEAMNFAIEYCLKNLIK